MPLISSDPLYKLAYDFIEKHFGKQLSHSDFSNELIALMKAAQLQLERTDKTRRSTS